MSLEILSDQRLARLDGEEIALGARAFDVLAYLHSHADRVVTKAELLEQVWADLNVEESNLSVQVAGLRRAIGHDRIKTVPGIGYRLILPGNTEDAQVAPKPTLPLPDKPSLAVLPFTNLTGSADRDYLVDGIANEVITALSRDLGTTLVRDADGWLAVGPGRAE